MGMGIPMPILSVLLHMYDTHRHGIYQQGSDWGKDSIT